MTLTHSQDLSFSVYQAVCSFLWTTAFQNVPKCWFLANQLPSVFLIEFCCPLLFGHFFTAHSERQLNLNLHCSSQTQATSELLYFEHGLTLKWQSSQCLIAFKPLQSGDRVLIQIHFSHIFYTDGNLLKLRDFNEVVMLLFFKMMWMLKY